MSRVKAGSKAKPPKLPTRAGLKNKGTRAGSDANGQGSYSNKPGGANRKKGYGAYGGYGGVDVGHVNALIRSMIRPELRALRGERRQVRRDANAAIGDTNDLYTRSVGDLNHIFDESGEFIQGANDKISQAYGAAGSQLTAAQQALSAQLASNGQGAVGDVNSELSRLGVQGSGNLSGLLGDQSFTQTAAQTSGVNNQANLAAMGANAQSIGQLLSGMNAGGRSSNLGRVLNERNETLGDITDAKLDGFSQVREAMRDVRGSRKDLMIQLLDQLQQTGWAQYMDQQQLNMQKRAMRRSGGGGGGGGYGSSSGSSSGSSGSSGFYGGLVDAQIAALSAGAPTSGGGKKKKKPKSPPPLNLGGGGYGSFLNSGV